MASPGGTSQIRWRGALATALVAAAGLAGAITAVRLFDQAVPQVRVAQRLTAPLAAEAARDFARAHALPWPAREAVRFAEADSLQLFLELSDSGGKAALDRAARDSAVALFTWTVRAFAPGDVHETRVRLDPDGRVIGFSRRLAEADTAPALDSAAAHDRARTVLRDWLAQADTDWRLVSASSEVVPTSARRDWRLTFEHASRRVAGAPLRWEVALGGDVPTGARRFVEIPEAFARRYAEMRASNLLLAQLASFGFPVYGLLALVALWRAQRTGTVRWRGAIVLAVIIAGLQAGSLANEVPLRWFDYPTASPPGTFLVRQALAAVLLPLLFGAFLVVVLAGGERLTRAAFPAHLDWWSAWRARGHPRVARQVLAGYALAAVGLGYIAAFYLVTRQAFGWWVPSALLDDPNLVATPLPFIDALANALQAGVMEEVLFRAVPLSAVALLTRGRPWRGAAMAAAVVVTALVFGFAHASYQSWPAYSRGVELFAEACLWAVVFLRFGLVPTVTCHVLFDLFLFGLFAWQGDAPAYRLALAVVALALAAPALLVAWSAWCQRGRAPAWEELTFGAAAARVAQDAEETVAAPDEAAASSGPSGALPEGTVASPAPDARPAWRTPRAPGWGVAATLALVALVAGLPLARIAPALARWLPASPVPPTFTVDRARAIAIADSTLRARGAALDGLLPLAETIVDDDAEERRYYAAHPGTGDSRTWARSYRPLAGWAVRFVRRDGTTAEKAEQWSLHLLPDGTPHDWRHVIAEDAPCAEVPRERSAAAALAALVAAGVDTLRLVPSGVDEERRPRRTDLVFRFTDTAASRAGLEARVQVRVSGAEAMGVARTLHLDEAWVRDDAAREERRGTRLLVAGLLLVVVVFAFAVRLARREPLAGDALPRRRTVAAIVAAGLLATTLAAVNGLPAMLAAWDTATPWRAHLAQVALGIAGQGFLLVAPVSLWMAADALRRRVGVVARASRPVTLRAGVALGASLALAARLATALLERGSPAPVTDLGAMWPALDGVLGAPLGLAMRPLAIALPALLVAGALPAWWGRRLVLLAAAAALALASRRPPGEALPAVLAVLLVLELAMRAVVAWGPAGVAAWVVAGATWQGLAALRGAAEATHVLDLASAIGGALAAALAIALVARRAPAGAVAPGR